MLYVVCCMLYVVCCMLYVVVSRIYHVVPMATLARTYASTMQPVDWITSRLIGSFSSIHQKTALPRTTTTSPMKKKQKREQIIRLSPRCSHTTTNVYLLQRNSREIIFFKRPYQGSGLIKKLVMRVWRVPSLVSSADERLTIRSQRLRVAEEEDRSLVRDRLQ